jgi:hypothetical protein
MRTLSVRDRLTGRPTLWRGWADWREGRRGPWSLWERAPTRPCPTCWGQRRIWEPGPLGLLPVWCEDCRGTGSLALADPDRVLEAPSWHDPQG